MSARRAPASTSLRTRLPPTKPAPPVTRTAASVRPGMSLLPVGNAQVGVGLRDAVPAVVVDGTAHALGERVGRNDPEVLQRLRRVEQDGVDVVGVARAHCDVLL